MTRERALRRFPGVLGLATCLLLTSLTGPALAADPPPPPPPPVPTAAPQMTPAPPPPPGPVPVAAPTMPPGAPPPAGEPVPTQAPEMTPTPMPPPPPAPPPPPPSAPAWGSSFGVRVGFRLQDPDQLKKMSEVHLDSGAYDTVVEARFHGAVTDNFSWVANFNANLLAGTLGAASGTVAMNSVGVPTYATLNVMDLIAQYKACDEFQIWAGRLLVPSDRFNFSGPFFTIPWNYPGFYPNGAVVLPHTGATGRDQGITVWGNALDAKLKYYGGAYGLDQGSPVSTVPALGNPYYSGRVSYTLQGSEPGYFGSSTYYGAANVVTIGVAGQYQKDGTSATQDAGLFMADAMVEENVTGVGTFTGIGQYYHFSNPSTPQDAYFIMLSYLTPNPVFGPGKLQPMVRLQETFNPGWTLFDAALAYVFKDYSGRVVLTYQHGEMSPLTTNSLQLGIQLQTL